MGNDIIGLIAGGRKFPFMVAQRAHEAGQKVVAAGFKGHTDPDLASAVDVYEEFHIGKLAKTLKYMKDNGVSNVVFAGTISKPKAMDIRPDFLAAKILFKLAANKGDDAILSSVADEFEKQGITVCSALDLIPGLATPEGVLTKKSPTKEEWADLKNAWPKAKAIGRMDIGQTLVFRSGIVLAVEGPEGTDAAIRRAGDLGGKGSVLCKVYKPGQDLRIDLPAAGLNTVETMIEIGGSCIGIEANKSIFFDREEAIELANKHGLKIVGLTPELLGVEDE